MKLINTIIMAAAATVLVSAAFGSVQIVIQEKDPMHAATFEAKTNKDSTLRGDVQKYGRDEAFTRWMQRDHPYVFANYCVKMTKMIAAHCKHTNEMSEFQSILTKRPDLKAGVANDGFDVTFVEWLRTTHPSVYKEHVADVTKADTMSK